jgi:hypothetical protein
MTGFHLVNLITQIRVFVPNDSYEFVHDQLAKFQDKVDEAAPGQTPEPMRVQSSETMQKMLAQFQQTKEKTEAGSLWTALSKWWSGSKDDSTAETVVPIPQTQTQTAQKAVPYIPPMPPVLPTDTFANTPVNTPQSAVPQLAIPQPAVPRPAAAEDFFIQRQEPLKTLSPLPSASSEPLSPLPMLAPLSELPEIEMPPTPLIPNHVGSELLLHNSGLPPKSNTSAKVFRPW